VFTTKQVSGLKIFLEIKRCAIVVDSIDDDEPVFVLLIVVEDDDKVSSVSIILISVETINGRVRFSFVDIDV
jgi:hypothetical protein